MPEVRSTLELDSSSALSTVDDLGSALDGVVQNFQSQFSDAVASVSVNVDSSGADTAIQSLGNESSAASEQVNSLSDSAKGLEGAALLATGSVGGMRTVVQGFGADAIPAVAGVLALVGGVGELIHSGIEATGQMQRFHATLGDLAGQVSTINVGSLNENLGKLAISLGSDDEAAFGASATLFQFATNAGIGRQQAAQFTEQVVAMAARAAALNPALGSIDQIIPQLSRGLATGGRFAQKFQLDLTATEIKAHATALGMQALGGQFSTTQLQIAGADLATQKYGASLKGDIATGTQNAIIQQRSLKEEVQNFIETAGKPLVVPFFDLFRAALPAVGALAGVLSTLAVGVLPSVTTAVSAVTPVLTALADVIEFLAPIIPPVVDAFIAFEVMQFLPSLLAGVAGGLEVLAGLFPIMGAAAETAAGEVAAASIALDSSAFGIVAVGIGLVIGALGLFGGAESDASAEVQDFTKALTDNGGALDDNAAKILRTHLEADGISTALDKSGVSFKQFSSAVESSNKQIDELAPNFAITAEGAGSMNAQLKAFDATVKGANPSLGALLESLRAQGVLTPDLANKIVRLANAHATAAAATKTRADIGATDTQITNNEAAATDALTQAVTNLAGSINAQVPTAAGQFSSFSQAVSSAFGGAIPSVQGFVDNLNSTVQGVASWLTNVQGLLSQNLPGLAQLVESQGAVIGGQLALQIQAATPATRIAWEQQIEQGTFALTQGKTTADTLAQQTAQAIIDNFSGVGAGVAGQVAQVPGAISGQAGAVEGAAVSLGGRAGAGFTAGVSAIPPAATQAVLGAGGNITSAGAAINEQGRSAGYGVGLLFSRGLAEGIEGGVSGVTRAAVDVVNQAKAAADKAAHNSPKYFTYYLGQGLMSQLAEGIGMGTSGAAKAAAASLVAVAQPAKAAFSDALSGNVTAGQTGAMSAVGGGVKVIVVRDLWEARDHLPAGVANDPAFLGGR